MTGRLPFDPARINRGKRAEPGGTSPPGLVVPGPDQPALPDGVLTISQLAARIDSALKLGVPGRVRVVGEISTVSQRTHWYFSLKDASAVVSAVVFMSAARKLRVLPTQGDRVIATGRLDYYAPSGRVSLIVDDLEPVGAGALERELKARVESLRARGWLDPQSKRPLPVFPRTIALVTSKDSAAVQDVIDTVRRRCPGVRLLIADVRVQGERAAPEIAAAVRTISRFAPTLGIDAVLVTRGGGSIEDLWAFNEMVVAEAIHDCSVPVVAAIGHETDVTIAELVADERAATPTQAAMRLVPDAEALDEQVVALARRMSAAVRQQALAERRHLAALANRPALRDPARVLDAHRDRFDRLTRALQAAGRGSILNAERSLHRAAARLERHRPAVIQARREEALRALTQRLERSLRTRVRLASESLDALHRELHALGPMRVLARGFSVTTTADGRLVRSPDGLAPGQQLLTRLAEGQVRSTVLGSDGQPPTQSPTGPASPPPPRRSRKPPGGLPTDRQMDLF